MVPELSQYDRMDVVSKMNITDYESMTVQIQSQYELEFLIESVLLNARSCDAAATAILRQLCNLRKALPPDPELLALLNELD